MRMTHSDYNACFDTATTKPIHGYYALVGFNQLYKLENQVYTECDTDGIYVAAASNGKKHALLISNITGKAQNLNIEGIDHEKAHYYVLDQQRFLSWNADCKTIAPNSVMLIEWYD
jgi:hypothetical protein